MEYISEPKIDVGQHGFVKCVDVMPSKNKSMNDELRCDLAIVQAARVSYGEGTKTLSTDAGLIRYLFRNAHTSPFEMVEFKFHIKCPIFVARQWLRHRCASVNEISARYSVMPDQFEKINEPRMQSANNKQCSSNDVLDDPDALATLSNYNENLQNNYDDYKKLVDAGMAREVARSHLPVSLYTEFFWKIDLHNLLNFLRLRLDAHAQKEIRDFAQGIFSMVQQTNPVSAKVFSDFKINSITLSGPEIEAICNRSPTISIKNKREQAEYTSKLEKLGLTF